MARDLFASQGSSAGRVLFEPETTQEQLAGDTPTSGVDAVRAQPYQEMFRAKPREYSYLTQRDGGRVDGAGSPVVGAGEVALSAGTGAISTPISGLAGIADLVMGGDLESASKAIESVQQGLTYEPKTETGIRYQESVSEALAPVGEVILDTGEALGDATREATGSWVLGGLAQSIPEAVLELAGVKGAGKVVKPKVSMEPKPMAALSQSAPEVKQLRQAASDLYNEIDSAGVEVPRSDYLNLGIKINNAARRSGYDESLTPKVKGFLDRLSSDYQKDSIKLTDIDQLRKVAQIPANSIENATEAAIGSKIISEIDSFLDSQGQKIADSGGADLGQKYKSARQLTSRVKKAELIDEAVFKASEAASGFENGLRNEIRSILKNKKKRRGFNAEEIKAMQQITQGGTMENLFKKLGKLGFGADQQTNMLLGSLGFAGGFAAGGPLGAALVPTIGYTSANIAKRLGKNNAKFLEEVVRAGKDGKEITKAYLDNVPKRLQRPEELSSLLSDPSIDATDIKDLGGKYRADKKFIEDSDYLNRKLRSAQVAGALAAQSPETEEQANE